MRVDRVRDRGDVAVAERRRAGLVLPDLDVARELLAADDAVRAALRGGQGVVRLVDGLAARPRRRRGSRSACSPSLDDSRGPALSRVDLGRAPLPAQRAEVTYVRAQRAAEGRLDGVGKAEARCVPLDDRRDRRVERMRRLREQVVLDLIVQAAEREGREPVPRAEVDRRLERWTPHSRASARNDATVAKAASSAQWASWKTTTMPRLSAMISPA